jgi:vancomycin resistance protein YoaR
MAGGGRHNGAMSRGRKFGIVAAALPVVLLAVLALSWFIDERVHADQAMRNISLNEQAVGGMGRDDLRVAVERLAEEYPDTAVTIELPDRTIETTVADLGGSVDVDATVARVLDVRRDQSVATRPISWARSLVSPDETGVELDFGEQQLRQAIAELEGDSRTEPTEPKIAFTEFGYVVTPGQDGMGIDPAVVEDVVTDGAAEGAVGSITVSTEQQAVPPRFTDDDGEAIADEATALVQAGIQITAGGQTADVATEVLGPWISSRPGEQELELYVVPDVLNEDLPNLLSDVGQAPVPASFTVENGVPVVIPSQSGTGCCAEGSDQAVIDALESGTTTVELDLTEIEPERNTAWAESLGIVEDISVPDEAGCGQYNADPCRRTTHHDCCASRVQNIHRMADLTRGFVIEPGGYFSPNEIVGPRTAANGFAVAGAIENGKHVDVVGGGVSQFATTSFNAAFFAGLDIPNYFMHDEYFSRYPYGRESTISYPEPEFRIQNNTPYGVLFWPVYTDTSLTVHLFSTRHAIGAVAGQSTSVSGNCTYVTTTRVRQYTDGHTENDSFSGAYRNNTGLPTC